MAEQRGPAVGVRDPSLTKSCGQHAGPQTNGGVPHLVRLDAALRSADLRVQAMGRMLDQLTWLVPMHIATFYTVDERLERYAPGPVVAKVSDSVRLDLDEAQRHYFEHHAARDPFAPARLPDRNMILATLRDVPGARWYAAELAATRSLVPAANLYFRIAGRIEAGISLVRESGAPQLSPSEIATLRRCHGCFEFFYGLSARTQLGDAHALEHGLTAREREVFVLLTRGKSNDAISQALGISHATVKTHVKHTFRKLGVANRHEALAALMNCDDHERAMWYLHDRPATRSLPLGRLDGSSAPR